ncbi:MAG TPA: LCP family protein [Acidimicrobiales bacterium]|nr:LCP family protein [Acidimicrobiales bacterium]
MTDGPPIGPEGVRIAATRAGQHTGDDDDLAAPNGHAETGGSAGSRRRRLRRASTATATPRVVHALGPTPAVAARPAAAVSPQRAKVLRQRRRRRRILIAVIILGILSTFFAGVVSLYVQSRLGQIKRVDVPNLADDVPGAVMNVLLVGSDSRANLEGTDATGFGKDVVGGQRSDTMMVLHIDPRAEKAAIVSVPRDLYLPIADTNFSDRVNAAFALGGPDQLVATIQRALNITINHYVQVDFVGFKDIVETVGGVTIYLPYPVRDSGSGLDIGKAGCFDLNGQQALAWVRSRKMEFLINGTWQEDGRADLGRIERQQDFIRRMMKKALSSGITNPIQLNRLIGIGVKDVTFDSALSTKDITALGRRFSSLDPDRVVLRTLPTDPADIDGKSVLKLQTAQAQPMIDLLNGRAPIDAAPTTIAGVGSTTSTTARAGTSSTVAGTASAVRPGDVRVRVLNGVGTPGAAAKVATSLTSAGFVVADKGDTPALAAKSTITYGTGQLAKAQLLQAALATPPTLKEDATLKAVDVSLVVGADYNGLKAAGAAGAAGSAQTTITTTTLASQITPVPVPKGAPPPPC